MSGDLRSQTTLGQVGHVRGGYVAHSATTDRVTAATTRALQVSDVAPDGSVDWSTLRFIEPVRDAERYLIRGNDVLVPLRSTRTSAVVTRDVPADTIAVGHWAIITVDSTQVDPNFIAWYLRHPVNALRLSRLAQGTKLQFLSLATLRDFEIELPPITLQQLIARAYRLKRQIEALEQELAAKRTQMLDTGTLAVLQFATTGNNPKA